jgi:hypothetical protein
MSKIMTWCTGLALAGVLAGCGQSAAAAGRPAGGSWGRVIEVPGLGSLSTGKHGYARVNAVSCASAGNCAAGGHYRGQRAIQQGFVAVERNGLWGTATGVPGLAALNQGGYAGVLTVSCASAGRCAAGGYYADADSHDTYGFVVSEENGGWGKAVTFPAGGDGEVDSISCASAGNCLAGGAASANYTSSDHGFVAEERNGRWGKAIAVPGLAALGAGGEAYVNSVSCGSAGNCAAGGLYTDRHGDEQGFVAVERNGAWGRAIAVPGLAALSKGGETEVSSVSCASAGSCVAGGDYQGSHGLRGFVAAERNGRWSTATGVPGLAALNKGGGQTMVLSVSCAPAGSCAAGGFYTDRSHHRQGFVATEDNGVWDTPIPMPGLAALNKGGSAEVGSLSCPSPGNCAAGGAYTDRSGHHQGFVTQAR